jgi:hypothetical protein
MGPGNMTVYHKSKSQHVRRLCLSKKKKFWNRFQSRLCYVILISPVISYCDFVLLSASNLLYFYGESIWQNSFWILAIL